MMDENNDDVTQTRYKIELTEEAVKALLRALRIYERICIRETEQIGNMPEGPCFPYIPGTVNPWTKLTIIGHRNYDLEKIDEIRREIEKAGYKIPKYRPWIGLTN